MAVAFGQDLTTLEPASLLVIGIPCPLFSVLNKKVGKVDAEGQPFDPFKATLGLVQTLAFQ